MIKNASRICLSGLLILITIAFTQCGKPFGGKGALQYSMNGAARGLAGESEEVSIEAFRTTVYPLTRQHCSSCHAVAQQPVHASPDLASAHNALVSQFKINFSTPANSRIVQKLRENHQCWSNCEDNAAQMKLAIETWANDLGNSASPDPVGQYDFVTESTMPIAQERLTVTNNTIIATTLAAAATLTSPMLYTSTAPGYVNVTPTGMNLTKTNNDASAGIANFSMMGTGVNRTNGALWGYVNAPNSNQDSFHVVMNGVNVDWQIPVTTGFKWVRVTRGAAQATQNFNLNAATNTITIREREAGAQLARLLWTQDLNFVPTGEGSAGIITLSFSLEPKIPISGARLEVKIEDYDAFSYRLSDLRIVVPGRYVYVKGIRLLVNDQFNPQNSNFTFIDQLVNPANNLLTPSNMIVLKEFGEAQDKISFAIDSLQLRGDPTLSLAAFQQTIYPITRQYCVSCHTSTQRPFHASNSPQTAHDDVINRYVIDFQNPAYSRIVEKLEEGHNCWSGSCTNDAQQMRNAVQAWGQMIGN